MAATGSNLRRGLVCRTCNEPPSQFGCNANGCRHPSNIALGPQHVGVLFWYRPGQRAGRLVGLTKTHATFAMREGIVPFTRAAAGKDFAMLPGDWREENGLIVRPVSAEELEAL